MASIVLRAPQPPGAAPRGPRGPRDVRLRHPGLGSADGRPLLRTEVCLQNIGRYTIHRELGKGSRGQVYLARDPLIGRDVVLKTLRTELAGNPDEARELLERFQMEARALGQLKHPAIVTIYDVGQDDAGSPYLAMEYVPGADLQTVTRSGMSLPVLQVADIGAQVAATLDFTHARGIVHRDIKPSNLLLGVDGCVRIADFGIVKFQGADITHVGLTLGTPSYMSPEQVRGDAVDGRTDIFSLGVVLYELLTGEKPFSGSGVGEVSRQVLKDHPLAPAAKRARVPRDLSSFVMRCLEKDPAHRWQRAGELAEALGAVARREREAGDAETAVRIAASVAELVPARADTAESEAAAPPLLDEPAGAAGTSVGLPSAESAALVAERDLIPLDPVAAPEAPSSVGRWVLGSVAVALAGVALLLWSVGATRLGGLFRGERPWVFSVPADELPTPPASDKPPRTPIPIPARSPDVEKRIGVARRDLEAGRFEEAAAKLRAIVAMAPDDAEARELLGRAERRAARPGAPGS